MFSLLVTPVEEPSCVPAALYRYRSRSPLACVKSIWTELPLAPAPTVLKLYQSTSVVEWMDRFDQDLAPVTVPRAAAVAWVSSGSKASPPGGGGVVPPARSRATRLAKGVP